MFSGDLKTAQKRTMHVVAAKLGQNYSCEVTFPFKSWFSRWCIKRNKNKLFCFGLTKIFSICLVWPLKWEASMSLSTHNSRKDIWRTNRILISCTSVFKLDAGRNYRQNIYVLARCLSKNCYFFHVNFKLDTKRILQEWVSALWINHTHTEERWHRLSVFVDNRCKHRVG